MKISPVTVIGKKCTDVSGIQYYSISKKYFGILCRYSVLNYFFYSGYCCKCNFCQYCDPAKGYFRSKICDVMSNSILATSIVPCSNCNDSRQISGLYGEYGWCILNQASNTTIKPHFCHSISTEKVQWYSNSVQYSTEALPLITYKL